jgi:prepilin-type N-terminal cleavage/methylation domain-containing protein
MRNGQWSVVSSQLSAGRRCRSRRGFTLIELLVVILIILIVSAVALPVVLPALSHRQVSEAARLLQGALVGARDSALKNGTPSGIRLLPDPAFPLVFDSTTGLIVTTQPLAANRIIPIEAAPEYSDGLLSIEIQNVTLNVQYPLINGGGRYPFGAGNPVTTANVLMVKEQVVFNSGTGNQVNNPTSWYWNIRVGDKLQINGSGLWYTVVGPMVVTPQDGNSELFVNVGPAGSQSPFANVQGMPQIAVNPEFLFLVNGIDDNKNGWIDEGYDGVDNNLSFEVANGTTHLTDELAEWEFEAWPAAIVANPPQNAQYTIQRRPTPVGNAREISLPTNVVIDMTSWGNAFQERSQFPPGVINPYTGYVDILLYPNGSIVPTTIYSTPSSFGMSGAFFHFWLAERADVASIQLDPNTGLPTPLVTNQPVYLPVGNINQQLISTSNPYTGPSLQGEYRIVTLFTRTGQVTSNDNPQFDNPLSPINGTTYNPGYPFLATEQGTKGGR